jgi:AraC-like DNA-binding protein
MVNQVETIIPVYDLRICIGAKDFAIKRVNPFQILGPLQLPHRQEGYNIALLLEGRITRFIDFEQHTIDAPAIICVGPDQVNQYVSAEKADVICISFSQDFLIGEMKRWVACWECMFNQVILNPDGEQLSELLVYSELMENEFNGDRAKKDAIIRNLLNAMIINIARMRTNIASVMQLDNSANKLVVQFKKIVDENFRSTTQVAKYAERLNVTPGHLNDVIKTSVGKTAKQIIDEKRIMEAKRLLFWANYNLKEIASLLSFEDDSYFNRFFKKHTGYTPYAFQRSIREKYN